MGSTARLRRAMSNQAIQSKSTQCLRLHHGSHMLAGDEAIVEGGRLVRSPSFSFPSRVFPSRVLCGMCGRPLPRADFVGEVCVMCDRDITTVKQKAEMKLLEDVVDRRTTSHTSMNRFSQVLAELRKTSEPGLAGIAETILTHLNGPEGLGRIMLEDFHEIRGTFLSEESRAFHEKDYKVLQRMYAMIIGLIGERDKQLGSGDGDAFEGLSDEDLNIVIAEAVRVRLAADNAYRRECLQLIEEFEPGLVQQFVLERMGVAVSDD